MGDPVSEVLGVTGSGRAVTWMGIRAAVVAVEVLARMAWIDSSGRCVRCQGTGSIGVHFPDGHHAEAEPCPDCTAEDDDAEFDLGGEG